MIFVPLQRLASCSQNPDICVFTPFHPLASDQNPPNLMVPVLWLEVAGADIFATRTAFGQEPLAR